MCARFFILIICVIAAYVTITVAAFIYLEWWQAILASALTLILIVFSGKYLIRSVVGSLADMAKGIFEAKSRVLRNAAADVHSIKPAAMPQPLAEWVQKVETQGPDPDEEAADPDGDVVQVEKMKNLRWYTIEATIFPDATHAKSMTHWDVDDLRLVPFEAKVSMNQEADDVDDFELHDVQLVENATASDLNEAKLQGPRRLRFTVGVPPGVRLLKFRYYFEAFGRLELPVLPRLADRVMSFPDHFSQHAADYREFRPGYPPKLFEYLASLPEEHHLAWDVGTGNGQVAVLLANHFERVLATDASAEQIVQAEVHPRVEYRVALAETSPCTDRSVDLVCIGQALHWFDFGRFYSEVRRVAKPGGIVAALSYNFHSVNPAVDAVLARYRERVDPFWPPQRRYVDEAYHTIPFPFRELSPPQFAMAASWPLAAYLGYLSTWSSTKEYQRSQHSDPVAALATEFEGAWGDPSQVCPVTWELALRVGVVD